MTQIITDINKLENLVAYLFKTKIKLKENGKIREDNVYFQLEKGRNISLIKNPYSIDLSQYLNEKQLHELNLELVKWCMYYFEKTILNIVNREIEILNNPQLIDSTINLCLNRLLTDEVFNELQIAIMKSHIELELESNVNNDK